MARKSKKNIRFITNQSSMELAKLLMIEHQFEGFIVVSDEEFKTGKFGPNDHKSSIGLSIGGVK